MNRQIPRSLELVCLKCLARSPGDRYASAAELAADLDRFLQGHALEARPPHFLQPLWRWTRREPALAIRLAALGMFAIVDFVNYSAGIGLTREGFHSSMAILIGLWAVSSILFQWLVKMRPGSIPARFGWGAIDSALLLSVLLVADGAASSLTVGYPLLIVASGLWYRVRFVWFMTALSVASYGVLVWDSWYRRPELAKTWYLGTDHHVIFLLALLVVAAVTSYLVARIRALSSYYGFRESLAAL